MSVPPIPFSPPSSPGSGKLEIVVVPSPRLLAALAAWCAAAGVAILQCTRCSPSARAMLLAACGSALAAVAAGWLPGIAPGAVRGLRLCDGRWSVRLGTAWVEVVLERSVEVLRAGWWLQCRVPGGRRRYWVWVDADRTPRAPFRALSRALQQHQRPIGPSGTAGRTRNGSAIDRSRRGSRRGEDGRH